MLRSGVLIDTPGIGDDVDVVVAVTAAGVMGDDIRGDIITGDGSVFDKLVGLLDREVVGFKMHQR